MGTRFTVLLFALATLFGAFSPAQAQQFGPPGGSLFGGGGQQQEVVTVAAQFTAPTAEKPARLFITATIKPGWHIYSISQAPGGPVRTGIELKQSDVFGLRGDFRAVPPPEKKNEPIFDDLLVEIHHGSVTWHVPIELAAGVDLATLRIEGWITAQPCDPNTCLPPNRFPFTATLGKGMELPPTEPAGGMSGFDADKLRENLRGRLQQSSMWREIVLGFLGGIMLNLMPCVLPVIGLKILSFVEQAGHSRWRALVLNIWYSLGLLSVFLLLASLAVFANLGWGHLFKYPGFNITMAAVVFVMGLSFLDVWEIPIPGFVGSGKTVELAEKEGFSGAFAKGVITTILATPCTGPFMGSALAWAVNQPPANTYAVFASVGLGMASPYLLIGAFPELIRFLPKPGAWMETFKQVMGFVLLGTVVYIFTFLDWPYVVPTIGLLFAIWAACWWISRTPPTADPGAKARAWLEAAAFVAALWILMFPGIDEIVPGRYAFGGLYDVMASRFDSAVQSRRHSGNRSSDEFPWQPFTSRADFERLVAAGKTVLIDFTADWCATCKTLEALNLNTPETRKLVEQNGVVVLKADWTHQQTKVTEMLDILGARQVPTIAIFPAGDPTNPIIFRGWYGQQNVLDALQEAGPSKRAL